jgi:hypothetical protein
VTDLRVWVANCPVIGRRFTQTLAGGSIRSRRNYLQFRLRGWTVDWYQTPEFHDVPVTERRDFQGAFVPTSDVFVRNVPRHRERQAIEVVTDICWLLSLASTSAVVPYQTHYEGRTHGWSVAAAFNEFRAPIEVYDGKTVETFVQACYPQFRRLKRRRKLPTAIDYLVYGHLPSMPLEVKLLIAFTVLEHLKSTWARTQGIPLIAGFYRKLDTTGHATRRSPRWSFDELVRAMLTEVKMRAALRRIVPLRNRLIHSGMTRLTVTRSFNLFGGIVDTLHKYLFRLLGYRGPMVDYRTLSHRGRP